MSSAYKELYGPLVKHTQLWVEVRATAGWLVVLPEGQAVRTVRFHGLQGELGFCSSCEWKMIYIASTPR